jgi:hypothetical protein
MALNDTETGKILVEENYLSEEELTVALKDAKKRKTELLTVLMEQGLITQHLYESALCEHYDLEFYDIQGNPPPPELVGLLPQELS